MNLLERLRMGVWPCAWGLCIALPWLTPLSSVPSSAVLPLLLSWSLAALLTLLVLRLPSGAAPSAAALGPGRGSFCAPWPCVSGSSPRHAAGYALLLCLLASLLWVPPVVDRAISVGLLAALTCIGLMVAVGRRAALHAILLRVCVAALLGAAAISAAMALLQYLGLAEPLAPWVSATTTDNVFANLRQRNQFATLTSFGLVALLAWMAWMTAPDAWRQSASMKTPASLPVQASTQTLTHAHARATWITAWLLLNLLAVGVACSQSRTGLLQWSGVGLVGGTVLLRRWRSQKQGRAWLANHERKHTDTDTINTNATSNPQWAWLALAAPLLVMFWSVLMPELALQLTGQINGSVMGRTLQVAQENIDCSSRLTLWHNVLTAIAQRPWLGWGWGETDYAHFMSTYSGTRFCALLDNAHNLPLQLALELGVPLTLLGSVLAALWVWRRAPWREANTWRVMAWGLLAVLGIHSLLEYPLWYGPFQMTLGLALGLLWASPTQLAAGGPHQHPDSAHGGAALGAAPRSHLGLIALACALLLGCAYAAWDFHRVSQIYRPLVQRDAAYRDQPLHHAQQSWLFKNQADFATLTTQAVTADNAAQIYPLALRLLHYSPEPRVVQRAIDSARLLGHDDVAQQLSQRLQAATP